MHAGHLLALVLLLLAAGPAVAGPTAWEKLEKAVIDGKRRDVPLAYDPDAKRFTVLGGRVTYADARKPRAYDVLGLDAEGRWENLFPPGKDWGPRHGPAMPPAWKDERFRFDDADGNTRPNWSVYGTFSLGGKYDRDPASKAFVFYGGGRTFRYDPAARSWADLAPANHPEKDVVGPILWGSMCYEAVGKTFVLFGGGNARTPRGDPGTWRYDPAANAWTRLTPKVEPPARANSRLAYDPVAKRVLLFGGDRLDALLADTWAFDPATGEWEQRKPARGPSPRAGHALLWLPKARKLLLVGGYGYTSATGYVESLYRPLPFEAWTYDAGADVWERLKLAPGALPTVPANAFVPAATDDTDTVVVLGTDGTWRGMVDTTETVPEAGVKPGTTERRTGPHDPAWLAEGLPPADPAKVAADLKALPANEWTARPTPKLPRPNMDWGSAVFDPGRDQIVRFSGGHSAYSGTAPVIYDVKTDRYALPFAPEYPIEYVYSNDQVDGEWSFRGRPWMTGHTYKSTGYDPNAKAFVFAPREYTYFFDPTAGAWSRSADKNPYRPDFYTVTVCATPAGAVVWGTREGKPGLWRMQDRVWKPLPLKGELPAMTADEHGMAHDAKRDRLLLFSGKGTHHGDVAEYDFKTGVARWLGPTGAARAVVQSRETAYVPALDAVVIGATVKTGDTSAWLMYDCTMNAWRGAEFRGANPIGKGPFNNSMGLMFDPNRGLLWAVGQNSHVFALRPDPAALKSIALE